MAKQFKTDRANRRQAMLENSLLELLTEREYADITVTDICRQSNIPRRTFYHYFNSKDEILDAVIEELMISCNLSSMFDFGSGPEAMRQSYVRFFRFWYDDSRQTLELLLARGLESQLIGYTARWIQTTDILLPRPAYIKPEMLELGRAVVSSSFFSLLFHWCRSGFRETPEELAEYVTWFMTHPIVEQNAPSAL